MTLSSSRIEIVGLGQIGSSLASAIIKNNLAKEVIGFTRNLETAKVAQKMGIVTKVFMDEKEIFKQKADLVIFAVPVHALIPLIQKIPDNQNSTLFLDVASVKKDVEKVARKKEIHYVSVHPMAGTERTGIAACNFQLFVNKPFLILPVSRFSIKTKKMIEDLAEGIGSFPIYLKSAKEHDEITAAVSHLPHLFAYTLLHTAQKTARKSKAIFWNCAGPSFLDASRVAGSSPEIVFDFLWNNRHSLVPVLDSAILQLAEISSWFKGSKKKALEDWIEEGSILKALASLAPSERR